MSTSTPIKNAKVKMEPREAGRAPPKKHENDGKNPEESGSGGNDMQKGRGKQDSRDRDGGDHHLETWAEFLKRSRVLMRKSATSSHE